MPVIVIRLLVFVAALGAVATACRILERLCNGHSLTAQEAVFPWLAGASCAIIGMTLWPWR